MSNLVEPVNTMHESKYFLCKTRKDFFNLQFCRCESSLLGKVLSREKEGGGEGKLVGTGELWHRQFLTNHRRKHSSATLSHLHQQLCLYFAGHLLRLKLNDTGVAIDECKGLQRQEEV